MKTLYTKWDALFTKIFLTIWTIFAGMHALELSGLINVHNINFYYLCIEIISKLTVNIVMTDHDEQSKQIQKNADLQCIAFLSYMLEQTNKFCDTHTIITGPCDSLIKYTRLQFKSKIPENKMLLRNELLQKILPLGFDAIYMSNTSEISNSKKYTMICILFTDIVNYTELARRYNETIIFQLLNRVYVMFDNIIKKYPHLQKIETIGDAYMVVGDIYRRDNNQCIVIKEIILLAFEFINEINTITTPDNVPLSIRIGINMGNVRIGILGNEIPRLCVVGNAVNVTSRLQSTADIDGIQMSRHIYEQLADIKFDIEFTVVTKENVFLKNIGSVTTFNIYSPPRRAAKLPFCR